MNDNNISELVFLMECFRVHGRNYHDDGPRTTHNTGCSWIVAKRSGKECCVVPI